MDCREGSGNALNVHNSATLDYSKKNEKVGMKCITVALFSYKTTWITVPGQNSEY
jgi:hypothetical protein